MRRDISSGQMLEVCRTVLLIYACINFVHSFGVSGFHRDFSGVRYSINAPSLTSSLQMAAIEIAMPALSSTMKEGKIVAWSKNVGDKVEVGDVLMVVESDKADMDVEAFEEGYLAKILIPEGGSQAVGASVALLASSPEEIASIAAGGDSPVPAATLPSTPIPDVTSSGIFVLPIINIVYLLFIHHI